MRKGTGLLWAFAAAALVSTACSGGETSLGDTETHDEATADVPLDGPAEAEVAQDVPPEAEADVAGDADADAPDAADDGGVLGPVTVRVTLRDWPGEPVPAPGVVVAFDDPDGTRTEEPTGSDGRVRFEASDWASGTAAVTTYVEGYQMVSRLGLTGYEGQVTLELARLGDPVDLVTLSGSVTGMDDAHRDNLAVCATVPNVLFGSNYPLHGPEWEIQVAPETACTLVATERLGALLSSRRGFTQEIQHWAAVDQAGVRVDAEVAIDFAADAVEPTTVTGSFRLPARAESLLRGPDSIGWPYVTSRGSDVTALVGLPTRTDIDGAATAVHWELEYLQPPAVTDPLTCYLVATTSMYHKTSHACEAGWPTAGEHDPGLLDLPVVTTEGTMSSPHPLFEPVAWELYDEGVHVAFAIGPLVGDDFYTFGANHNGRATAPWLVLLPDDATGVTVPQPVSTASLDVVLAGFNTLGYVAIWQEDPSGEFEARWTRSDSLWLER